MSPLPLQIPPPPSGSGIMAALPYFLALAGPVLGYFGARFTATARLERTLLDASRSWVEQSQTMHASDSARIFELEAEILRQRGEINQHLQRVESLERFIERSGLTIPGK